MSDAVKRDGTMRWYLIHFQDNEGTAYVCGDCVAYDSIRGVEKIQRISLRGISDSCYSCNRLK